MAATKHKTRAILSGAPWLSTQISFSDTSLSRRQVNKQKHVNYSTENRRREALQVKLRKERF